MLLTVLYVPSYKTVLILQIGTCLRLTTWLFFAYMLVTEIRTCKSKIILVVLIYSCTSFALIKIQFFITSKNPSTLDLLAFNHLRCNMSHMITTQV